MSLAPLLTPRVERLAGSLASCGTPRTHSRMMLDPGNTGASAQTCLASLTRGSCKAKHKQKGNIIRSLDPGNNNKPAFLEGSEQEGGVQASDRNLRPAKGSTDARRESDQEVSVWNFGSTPGSARRAYLGQRTTAAAAPCPGHSGNLFSQVWVA